MPERDIPDYVAPDGNDKVTFTRVPKLDEVPYPVTMEPNLVVEFYAKKRRFRHRGGPSRGRPTLPD